MAGETAITLIGTLTADPELKFTPAGAACATFTVASNERHFDKSTQEWVDGEPMFIRCETWRDLAEHVSASLTKGTRVIATGALRVRNFERKDGSKGTSVELRVDEVGPSLRWATAQIQREQRGRQQAGQTWGQQPASPAADANPWNAAPPATPGWGQPSTQAPPF